MKKRIPKKLSLHRFIISKIYHRYSENIKGGSNINTCNDRTMHPACHTGLTCSAGGMG